MKRNLWKVILCAVFASVIGAGAARGQSPPPAFNSEPFLASIGSPCAAGERCWVWSEVMDCNGTPFTTDHYNFYHLINHWVDLYCTPSGTPVRFCYCDATGATAKECTTTEAVCSTDAECGLDGPCVTSCPADPTFCEDYGLTQGYYPSPGTHSCGYRTNEGLHQDYYWITTLFTPDIFDTPPPTYCPDYCSSAADQPMVYWYYLEAVNTLQESSFTLGCP